MDAEQGFVEHLVEDLDDDVTRLVYADWLDERGDVRGQYLRLEHEVASLELLDPRRSESEKRLAELLQEVPARWVEQVGLRFDVWLVAYPPDQKIHTIKVIREVTGQGLADAKNTSESLPAKVLAGLPRTQAQHACWQFSGNPLPSERRFRTVIFMLRSGKSLDLASLENAFGVILSLLYVHGQEAQVVGAVQVIARCNEATARELVAKKGPLPLQTYPTRADALAAARLLVYHASFDVRINFPASVGIDLAQPRFDVYLGEIPARNRLKVLRLLRRETGSSLQEVSQMLETLPPILLRQDGTAEEAERLRASFGSLAEVEVRKRP